MPDIFTEEAGPVSITDIGAIANLGGTALIAVLFFWVLTKRMPQQESEYRKDIQLVTSAFQQELKAERDARYKQQETFSDAVKQLSASTLGSFERIIEEVREIKNGHSSRSEKTG